MPKKEEWLPVMAANELEKALGRQGVPALEVLEHLLRYLRIGKRPRKGERTRASDFLFAQLREYRTHYMREDWKRARTSMLRRLLALAHVP
jgi:hypothetical protein